MKDNLGTIEGVLWYGKETNLAIYSGAGRYWAKCLLSQRFVGQARTQQGPCGMVILAKIEAVPGRNWIRGFTGDRCND
jgi:hypothetical protein